MVFASYTPVDDYQRFALDCATIRRGTPVGDFEAHMTKRGWTRTEQDADMTSFSPGGAEVFLVYFDPKTREITHWRYLHD